MDFKERYRFNVQTDLIGKGGFSRVYKAHDEIRKRQVALKFYYGVWSDKYDIIGEIGRIDDIVHPNLIRYYDADILKSVNAIGEEESIQVGILEFANSGDISELSKDTSPKAHLSIIRDVLSGLAHLHSKGIAHRDLKPKNILLHRAENKMIAKIGDFGISKVVGVEEEKASTQLLGSVEYMAPEQFNTTKYGINGALSTNVDLWALGIITYEMVTYRTPFGNRSTGLSNEQILSNILFNEILLNKHSLVEPFKTIVERCLVKNAGERVMDANELIEVIDQYESKASPVHFDLTRDAEKPVSEVANQETEVVQRTAPPANIDTPQEDSVVSSSPEPGIGQSPEPVSESSPEPSVEQGFQQTGSTDIPSIKVGQQESAIPLAKLEDDEVDVNATQVISGIPLSLRNKTETKKESPQNEESKSAAPKQVAPENVNPIKDRFGDKSVTAPVSKRAAFDMKQYQQPIRPSGKPTSAESKRNIEDGVRYFEQQNFEQSFAKLNPYLDTTELDTKAKFYLAYMYYNGKCGGSHNSALGRRLMDETKKENRALVLDLMLNNVLEDYNKTKG